MDGWAAGREEDSIVQRVQDGDAEAFGELMDLHGARVRRVLALAAPAPHLIDELAHETFVFAYQHLGGFKRGTSFAAWLCAIARNLLRWEVLKFTRERRNRLRYASTRDGADARTAPEPGVFERLLGQAGPGARELLDLRYRASLSTREIARRLGRSDGWVRTSLCRIRQRLRNGLAVESS
jgi:RNA polymerase sigma-70 factor (ECF subfamily)